MGVSILIALLSDRNDNKREGSALPQFINNPKNWKNDNTK